jgi:hypothetical protein
MQTTPRGIPGSQTSPAPGDGAAWPLGFVCTYAACSSISSATGRRTSWRWILSVAPLLTAVLLMAFTLVATLISQSFWEFTEAAR